MLVPLGMASLFLQVTVLSRFNENGVEPYSWPDV